MRGGSTIVHVEALSSTRVLVVLEHEALLFTRCVCSQPNNDPDLGATFSQTIYQWMPSVCPLGQRSDSEAERSYLTAKYLPSKQLLAVLSSIHGKGECQVFFIDALPLKSDFSVEAVAEQSPTWQPPPVDMKLVHSLCDDALISGTDGHVRAFWHSIMEPNWDFLYLVVFSVQQCQLVIIPGDVVEVRSFFFLFCSTVRGFVFVVALFVVSYSEQRSAGS